MGTVLVYAVFEFHATYTVSLQSPVKIRFEWPLVVARRAETRMHMRRKWIRAIR